MHAPSIWSIPPKTDMKGSHTTRWGPIVAERGFVAPVGANDKEPRSAVLTGVVWWSG